MLWGIKLKQPLSPTNTFLQNIYLRYFMNWERQWTLKFYSKCGKRYCYNSQYQTPKILHSVNSTLGAKYKWLCLPLLAEYHSPIYHGPKAFSSLCTASRYQGRVNRTVIGMCQTITDSMLGLYLKKTNSITITMIIINNDVCGCVWVCLCTLRVCAQRQYTHTLHANQHILP